jgi:8-oxo-dGTP pyrophosphatase MutT (NUDIX family)
MKNLLLKLKLFFLLVVVIFLKKINRSGSKNFQVTALEDGKKYWISRSVAVDAMIVSYNKISEKFYVLMVKRGKGLVSHPNYWCIPCGFMDFSENGYQAVSRELWEETNLNLSELLEMDVIKNYTNTPYFVNTEPLKVDNQNVSLYYGLYLSVDELPEISNINCEPDEIDEVRWVEIFKELPTLDKIAFNHQQRVKEFCEMNFIY